MKSKKKHPEVSENHIKTEEEKFPFLPFFVITSPCCRESFESHLSGLPLPGPSPLAPFQTLENRNIPFETSLGAHPEECNTLVILGAVHESLGPLLEEVKSRIRHPRRVLILGDCALNNQKEYLGALDLETFFPGSKTFPGHNFSREEMLKLFTGNFAWN